MASTRNPQPAGTAAASRLSLAASDAPSTSALPTRRGTPVVQGAAESKYSITAVLAEPQHQGGLLPSLPALPSASSYLPAQLSSLSTTFTSAGTLPRSAAPGAKSVAQRRSQAPPIQVTELRRVAKTEFDSYLREVGDDFERWQRESRDSAADLGDGDDALVSADEHDMVGLGLGGGERRAPFGSRTATRPPPKAGKAEEVLPSLDDVPQIFFDSAFDLANPRTFDLVTERIQLSPHSSPHSSPHLSLPAEPSSSAASGSLDAVPGLGPHTLNDLAADQVLQDKLSHYTAVIESHLVREIGLRSSSFFAALSNLQSLHQEGEAALAKITELQAALTAGEGGVGSTAQRGLQILRAQARRRGLERIEEAVRAVEEVWTAVEGVMELVENGEWDGALEVSEQIEEAYFGSSAGGDEASTSSATLSSSVLTPTKAATTRRPPTRPINLTKLRALSSLPAKLALLRAQIAKSLEGELISVLEHELDVGIDEHVRLAGAGRRWKGKGRAAEPAHAGRALGRALQDVPEEETEDGAVEPAPEDVARERTAERVRPVVAALVRAEGADSAVLAWRESVLREVRALVREHLPTAETPSVEEEDHFAQVAVRSVSRGASVDLGTISEKSVSLAKKLRALSHAAFVALAQDTYAGLLACIEVVDLQARVLVDAWNASRQAERARKTRRRARHAGAGETARPQPPASSSLAVPGSSADLSASAVAAPMDALRSSTSDDGASLATEISDVVHAVAELANVRFSKVIGVRTEVHAQLALAEFVDIFDLSWTFVVQCEVVCQRMIVGLRGAMVSQAKTFLQAFHQRQITENARVVEEEQWAAAEVPPATQAHVQLIIDAATTDPTELLLGARRAARQSAEGTNAEQLEGRGDTAPESAKQVQVEGRQFFVVPAGLVTIAVLVEYLKVLVNIPMLTTDAMSKVIEFMKVFNSRTCQVVLGAGAMRSAGLKNITAKHLALASQALSVMIALIPYIREAVRRHLNPKQAVMLTEFDKLKRDYQEHQHEIHAKLVAIMSDRLQVHSRTLEGVNFEEPAPRAAGAPNAYMEALVKEHNTLYKVLSRFLATETVAGIMSQVFGALDTRLAEVFARLEPKSLDARDRMLIDVRYLRERLGELKGMEVCGPGKDLESLVEAKPVPQTSAPPAPTPAPIAGGRPSLPPRTSSIPPPSPSLSVSTSATSAPLPVPVPVPAQAPYSTPQASTSSTSLSSAAQPTQPPQPQPPSPVTVPALHPPSPKAAEPAPYVSRKKKTLAERLAESMGLAAKAPPPQQQGEPVSALAAASSEPSEPAPRISAGELTPRALERALESGVDVDTPALEQALRLEGFESVPVPAPAMEEVEDAEQAVERELAPNEVPTGSPEVEEEGQARPPTERTTAREIDELEALAGEVDGAEEASAAAPADEPSDGALQLGDTLEPAGGRVDELDEHAVLASEEVVVTPVAAEDPPQPLIQDDARASSPPTDAPAPATEEPPTPAVLDRASAPLDDPSVVPDVEKAAASLPAESPALEEPPAPQADRGEAPAVDRDGAPADASSAEPAIAASSAGSLAEEARAPVVPADAEEQESVVPVPIPVPVIEVDTSAPALSEGVAPPPTEQPASAAETAVPASPPPSSTAAPAPPDADHAPPPAENASLPAPAAAPSPPAPATTAPAPARRKTLKERLAEAARRGSTGGLVSPPPTSPAPTPSPSPSPSPAAAGGLANGDGPENGQDHGRVTRAGATDRGGGGDGERVRGQLVASPDGGAMAAEELPVCAERGGAVLEGETEPAPAVEVEEEEESRFL
ncbi:hypothetical protein JCM3770_001367 [Rhodotorula araucariae]